MTLPVGHRSLTIARAAAHAALAVLLCLLGLWLVVRLPEWRGAVLLPCLPLLAPAHRRSPCTFT